MEAPDIIYTDGKNTCASAPIFSNTDGNIKYIRADLAELNWEDIKKIELLLFAIECSSTHPYKGEDLYKEVLCRFLESKKEIKL